MTEYMTAAVLAGEVSEVGSKTHVCSCALLEIPFINGNASEQPESSAINQDLSELLEALGKLGKGEVGLVYMSVTISCKFLEFLDLP